jgi:hypothetical protein
LSRPIIFPSPEIALYNYLKFDVDFNRGRGEFGRDGKLLTSKFDLN